MMSFDDLPHTQPKRQRALSFEEIEEEYEERSKRVPFNFSDNDSDDSIDSSNENGVDDSFSMDEISPRFKIERVLGKGSYGLVVRATDPQSNNRAVAVKRLKHVFDTCEVTQRVLNEIRLLRALGVHPNVTSLHSLLRDVSASEDTFNVIYMTLEAADSDLFKILNSTIILNSQQVRSIIHQTLTALSWLHSCNVIHCDVKPANLLVDGDCRIRLADFGLSRWSTKSLNSSVDTASCESTVVAVPTPVVKGHRSFLRVQTLVGVDSDHSDEVVLECCYRAPEVLWPRDDNEPYRASLDIWSAGCVFAELLRAMTDNEEIEGADSLNNTTQGDIPSDTVQPAISSPTQSSKQASNLPLDSTGRVLGGHRHRPPIFAVKNPPSWLDLASSSVVLSQPTLSQESDCWSKSPTNAILLNNGRRSRSPRPETLEPPFSSDSRRVLSSFLHVLGPSALCLKDCTSTAQKDENLGYLSSGARSFVIAAFEHIESAETKTKHLDIACADDRSLKLLQQLLLFPPHLRPTAEAALDNEYFSGMPKTPPPAGIVTLPPPSLSRGLLRKELWNEIDGYINQ